MGSIQPQPHPSLPYATRSSRTSKRPEVDVTLPPPADHQSHAESIFLEGLTEIYRRLADGTPLDALEDEARYILLRTSAVAQVGVSTPKVNLPRE
jgi:hypothetical protein